MRRQRMFLRDSSRVQTRQPAQVIPDTVGGISTDVSQKVQRCRGEAVHHEASLDQQGDNHERSSPADHAVLLSAFNFDEGVAAGTGADKYGMRARGCVGRCKRGEKGIAGLCGVT
eukprot:6195037-Pleurochrysis_carterae.AAC.3